MKNITESFSFLQTTIKKVTGTDALFGDVDPGIQSMPVIIITPEETGELLELATGSTNIVIPLKINIRVDEKQVLKAYAILEKIILGLGSLREERGYTFGNSVNTGGRAIGNITPTFSDSGYFNLALDFKIQEIVIKT